MTNAYLYLRFSTPRQEAGSSRERQEADCRAYIERKGWTLVEPIIADLGRSAWKGVHLQKGKLGKFAKRILNGDVAPGVIVVENLDRLSRQKPRVTQRWMEDICDAGFKIASVKGDKVYDADSLQTNILDILDVLYQGKAANDYVETLSTRSKASVEARLKQARIDNTAVHAIGPAWLEPIGKRPHIKWEPIPERVKIVNEIFDLTVAGKPAWTIAGIFNERGEKSFTGRAWERTAIVKILRNRAVEADYVVGEGKNQKPTGEVLIGYYDKPIVPLDVIAVARAMLDSRRNGSGRNSGAINNLFGKKIRCSKCDGRMNQIGYQNRYLTCYEAGRRNGCTQRTTFKYRPFEAAALDAILPLALDEQFFRQAQKSNGLSVDIAIVEKNIRDKIAEVERVGDTLSRVSSRTMEAKLVSLEAEIDALREKQAALSEALAKAQGVADAEAHLARVHTFRDALNHPDEDIRLPARLRASAALQAVVDGIRCGISPVDGEKTITLTLLDGIHAFVFDNEGTKTFEFRATAEDVDSLFDERTTPEMRAKTEAYFKRRASGA